MCGGGGGGSKQTPVAPTVQYGPADYSNSQQQKAAISQDGGTTSTASYGSELGSSTSNAASGSK